MGERSLRLDLYSPQSSSRLPVIVWIHGGGWRTGSKDKSLALRETERGYAVASIDYRLSYEALFPAQIHDCKAAIRWLRANSAEYNLDPDRIVAWGASAGGHLSALLGTSGGIAELEGDGGSPGYSSRVQAVIDWYGPVDLLTMQSHGDAQGCDRSYFNAGSAVAQLLGCKVPDCPDRAKQASPITYISPDDPPFLIMHGTEDCIVPTGESQEFFDALSEASVDATLSLVEGAAHGGEGFRSTAVAQTVDSFLDRQLAPGDLTLRFPHIAAGPGVSSVLTLVNRSSTRSATVRVRLKDDQGGPLSLGLNGQEGSVEEYSIPPSGRVDLATSQYSRIYSGSVHVDTDVPLAGIVRFSVTALGSTGVAQAPEVSGFVAPVSRSANAGLDTGIAMASVGEQLTVDLTLHSRNGEAVAGGHAVVELPAGGRVSKLLEELFPEASIKEFEGVLTARTSGGEIVAHVLGFGSHPGELVSLPVTALEP